MITQVEIARRVGLDVSSVNKILNRTPGPVFKKKTIKLVFKVAREMGYDFERVTKPQLKRKVETLQKVLEGNELVVRALRKVLSAFIVPEAELDRRIALAMKDDLMGEANQKIA